MKKRLFSGVGTALVTPFDQTDHLNETVLRQMLRFQLANGADAVILCGTTGESATLSDKEKQRIFSVGAEELGGKLPLIAGVGSNDTHHTQKLAKIAEQCGVDGLLVVTPYYNKTTQAGAVQHFVSVADQTALPVLLYNVPSRTGMDLSADTVATLAAHPNIVGIKEACGNMEKIARMRATCPEDFLIYAGNDTEILPVLALGGSGVISVSSNLLPNMVHCICTAFVRGDLAAARQLQLRLLPLTELLFRLVNPICVKPLMELIGFPCGEARLPLEQLDNDQKTELRSMAQPILQALTDG